MADDFSSRVQRRSLNVGLGNRPTPDDIDDLRRRQEEHAKRTQAPPVKSFGDVLQDKEQSDGQPSELEPEAHGDTADVPDGGQGSQHKPLPRPKQRPSASAPRPGRGRIIRG